MANEYIDHFYVIPDLSVRGPLDVRTYASVQEAAAAYKALPADKLKALGISNTSTPPGALDFVQCKDGRNMLLTESLRVPQWDNREIRRAVEYMKENIELIENPEIRFITPEYDTLFFLPDGETLTRYYPNGTAKDTVCHAYPDGYHFKLGWNTFHICEFAELCREQGITIEPMKRPPGLQLNTYEIYQVRDLAMCDYAFRSYAEAASKLNAKDYWFSYAGMLGKKMDLETLYQLHNRDDRPLRYGMRAMSLSDVVVINRGDRSAAYYVDDIGFRELPGFADRLKEERLRQGARLGRDR